MCTTTGQAFAGAAPPGADCDAQVTPVVTGHVDPGVLDQLAAILLRNPDSHGGTGGNGTGTGSVAGTGRAGGRGQQLSVRAVRQLAIGQAARLLSGPGGLASWLRASQPDGYAAPVSLPLDIGAATETIPVHLRKAVTRRDAHCRFPGCQQPPGACQVHHLVPRSEGGPTSLDNCCLLCVFHHLIAVHRWGWRLTLNPDTTTTAISPDADRTLHSHPPPEMAA